MPIPNADERANPQDERELGRRQARSLRISPAKALAVLAAAIMAGIGVFDIEARARSSEPVRLTLGDRIEFDHSAVGCRVARLSGHGKQVFLDCRRAGALRGTYGTYVGKERVLVVRYLDSDTARVVFSARHEGNAERCVRTPRDPCGG
jgi:hypothetical protein